MREFSTPADFAHFLRQAAAHSRKGQEEGLRKASEIFAEEAKAEIGHYQGAAGPFEAWPTLADTTLNGYTTDGGKHFPGKIELGYSPPDNPLLREGDLRSSIGSAHDEHHAVVGSDSQIAVWQELGTKRMPARSFLGRAVFVKVKEAMKVIVQSSLGHLAGR